MDNIKKIIVEQKSITADTAHQVLQAALTEGINVKKTINQSKVKKITTRIGYSNYAAITVAITSTLFPLPIDNRLFLRKAMQFITTL